MKGIGRNPRLLVVQSVQSLAFQLAGSCSESLIDNSHDEVDQSLRDTYCDVQINSPDLTPVFIAALAALVASYWIPDIVFDPGSDIPHFDEHIPTGRYVGMAAIFVALNILAATGNFHYRIYAQPVCHVRRTVQASADDLEMQARMGNIIAEAPFKDPLCGSALECEAVAEFLKMVARGERRRWSAEMVADLHNEEGDKISVLHPASGQSIEVFITDLKTTYIVPDGQGEGGILQEFEGWRTNDSVDIVRTFFRS